MRRQVIVRREVMEQLRLAVSYAEPRFQDRPLQVGQFSERGTNPVCVERLRVSVRARQAGHEASQVFRQEVPPVDDYLVLMTIWSL